MWQTKRMDILFRSPRPVLCALLLMFTASCGLNQTPERGLASEAGAVPVEAVSLDSKATYDLASVHRSLPLKSGGGDQLLGGFLAASAEDVLKSENLEEVIGRNADRACVYLGQVHGRSHKHAVNFETSGLIGPMISPVDGQVSQQRAVPLSQHETLSRFCKKASLSDSKALSAYRSKCLVTQSMEVMPVHFTALECDNIIKGQPTGPAQMAPQRSEPGPGHRAIR